MAAGIIVVPSLFPARDRTGRLVSGALLEVRENRTTTKATVYADASLSTPLANPIVANSSGHFPLIWAEAGTVEDPTLYTVAISGPGGVSIANPSVFHDWQPSLDADTAAMALAQGAADQAGEYLEDIEEILLTAPEAVAIAGRAKIDGSNILLPEFWNALDIYPPGTGPNLAASFLCAPFRGASYSGNEIFPGAGAAPQGVTSFRQNGKWYACFKQRVGSDALGEIYRFIVYELKRDGSEPAHDWFSTTFHSGHHGIGCFVEDGVRKAVMSYPTIPSAVVPTPSRRGVQIAPLSPTISDAQITNYWLLKNEFPSATDVSASELYGDIATCTDDGEYIVFGFQALANSEGTNNAGFVRVYRRADLEAVAPVAGLADCTAVSPIAEWRLQQPTTYNGFDYQDCCARDGKVWFYSGSTAALAPHYVQCYDLFTGRLIESLAVDGARGNWTRSQLLGLGPLGNPLSFEAEGIFLTDEDEVCLVTQTIWSDGDSIVTYGGQNFAMTWSGAGIVPGSDRRSQLTLRAATAGEWNPATSYVAGARTYQKALITSIHRATGAPGERGVKTSRTERAPDVDVMLGERDWNLGIPLTGRLGIARFKDQTGQYIPAITEDGTRLTGYGQSVNKTPASEAESNPYRLCAWAQADGAWTPFTRFAGIGFGSDDLTGGSTPGIRAFIDAFAENASGGETGLAFGTGPGGVPTTKWRLGVLGHWTPAGDGLYDIGSATMRPRRVIPKFLNTGPMSSVVTLASDTVTPTSTYCLVDTEGGAATDDLTTITGTFADGDILVLRTNSNSRDVRVVAGAKLVLGAPYRWLKTATRRLTLQYDAGADAWIEISWSGLEEVGAFTPGVAGQTTPGNPVFSSRAGFWKRVGPLVFWQARFALSSKGGMAGQVKMTGLPFTIEGDLTVTGAKADPSFYSGITLPAGGNELAGWGLSGGTEFRFVYSTESSGSASLLDTHLSDTATVYLSGVYSTADA